MPTARGWLAAGVVNGILYAVGGANNGPLNRVEAYDPVTNTWTRKTNMPTARFWSAVGVIHGILYSVGGYDDNNILNTVEAFNPQ